jgi:hypothetical protein
VTGRNQRHWLLSHILTRFITQPAALPSYNSLKKGNDYETCTESYAISYMNRDVRPHSTQKQHTQPFFVLDA